MAMDLTTVDGDGLFDILGKGFKALNALNTARGTTVPVVVADYLAQWAKKTGLPLDSATALAEVPGAAISWEGSGDGLAQTLADSLQQVLVALASEDFGAALSVSESLQLLIDQMIAGGYNVTGATTSVSITPGGSNAGDVVLAATLRRGDGQTQQYAIPEDVRISVGAAGLTPQLRVQSNPAQRDLLAADWPLGSGLDFTLPTVTAATSLLSVGDFAASGADPNLPQGWYLDVGTLGTTIQLTVTEVQTVAISGTPTGGNYLLIYTDPAGRKWPTTPIVYNASTSVVQAALRQIPDLAAVVVSSAGTLPNVTHTITFTDRAGDVAALTSQNLLTGGSPSISHATSTGGDALAFRGQSLILTGNGSQLTTIAAPVACDPDRVYFCNFRLRRSGSAAAGVFKAAIVDGFQGAGFTDSAGGVTYRTVNASAIPTSPTAYSFSFRVPATVVQPVWLSLGFSTAVTNACKIMVDEVAITPGVELYSGGPFVAAFAGAVVVPATDAWTVTVANDRAGLLQEAFARCFNLPARRLLLPVTGSHLIPDSLVS